ncbi:hypothetical protein [Hymenobacter rubidus]|uniref:hypothetical protein n=1 Tax=Hymenobacter rubidus TaxID=1441626 RepID=UPI00191DD8AD|nr:hypothetical protein [Hymenobacter rubidus]
MAHFPLLRFSAAWALGRTLLLGLGLPAVALAQAPRDTQALELQGGSLTYRPLAAQQTSNAPASSTDSGFGLDYQGGALRLVIPWPATKKDITEKAPIDWTANPGRNIVAVRYMDLIFDNATLTYERLFGPNNQVGVKLPFSLKYGRNQSPLLNQSAIYPMNKSFSTGLEVNFYVGPPARVRYFLGPAVHYGRFRYDYSEGPDDFLLFSLSFRNRRAIAERYACYFNNGLRYQLGKHFVLAADAGIGWKTNVLDDRRMNLKTDDIAGTSLLLVGNFNLGYHF